jgi:rSAM/selenodomain-associated transferase 1
MSFPLRTLGLFAKQPLPGAVKTRLAAVTSASWAAQVAAACLHDTVERLSRVQARHVLAYAPASAEPFFAGLAQQRFDLTCQRQGDLGERMGTFFEEQLQVGGGPLVLVGADSPTLPLHFIEQAFIDLERADLVLGPATDGGYYLIGCSTWQPALFTGISWGGCRVLVETIARLKDSNSRLALLPPWYDVDSIDDWSMLCGHIAAMRRAGIDPEVPHLEALALA